MDTLLLARIHWTEGSIQRSSCNQSHKESCATSNLWCAANTPTSCPVSIHYRPTQTLPFLPIASWQQSWPMYDKGRRPNPPPLSWASRRGKWEHHWCLPPTHYLLMVRQIQSNFDGHRIPHAAKLDRTTFIVKKNQPILCTLSHDRCYLLHFVWFLICCNKWLHRRQPSMLICSTRV